MSADFPIIGDGGGIQLAAVLGKDGEMRLLLGRPDEPGVAELLIAITKLAKYVNTLGSCTDAERRAATEELAAATEALWLIGQVSV